MKVKINCVEKYLLNESNNVLNKILEIEQIIENISISLEQVKVHISIIKEKEKNEKNIFRPNNKENLDLNLEKLSDSEKIYKNRMNTEMKNLKVLKDEYQNIQDVIESFHYIKQMVEEQKTKENMEHVINKVEFCRNILELDKDRCKIELDNILNIYKR